MTNSMERTKIHLTTRRLSVLRVAAQRARVEERAELVNPTEQNAAKKEIAGALETMAFGLKRGQIVEIEEDLDGRSREIQVRVSNITHILKQEAAIDAISAVLFPKTDETEFRRRLFEGERFLVSSPQPPSTPARILQFRPRA